MSRVVPKKVPSSLRLRSGGYVRLAQLAEDDEEIEGDGQEEEEERSRAFEMLAYSGGPVDTLFGPMVIDISGMDLSLAELILLNHDEDQMAGLIGEIDVGDELRITGELFEDEPASDKIARLQAKGVNWQSSIGFNIGRIEWLEEDDEEEVNGSAFAGPGLIVRESELLESSVVPIGRDRNTSTQVQMAKFAEKGGTVSVQKKENHGAGAVEKTAEAIDDRGTVSLGASVEELEEAFPDAPEWALKAIKRGWSVEKAKAERYDEINEKLAEELAARQRAENKTNRLKESPGVSISLGDRQKTLELTGERDLSHLPIHVRAAEVAKGLKDRPGDLWRVGRLGNDPTDQDEALAIYQAALMAEYAGKINYLAGSPEMRLAAASKQGYYDILDDRAVVGTFYRRYEVELEDQWAFRVAFWNPDADQRVETYPSLGGAPMMRPWVGGRQVRKVDKYSFTVENVVHEATVGVATADLRRDKTSQIRVRIANMASKAASHWNKLATDEIEENNNAYDGQTLYNQTQHNLSGSDVVNNAPDSGDIGSLNVADTSSVTAEEAADIMVDVISHMYGFKDEEGDPVNGSARQWVVVVPILHQGAFRHGLNANLLNSGSTNPVLSQRFNIDVVPNARLDNNLNHLFFFREDSMLGGLLLQEEEGVVSTMLGRGSDHEFKTGQQLFGIEASRAAGPGEITMTARATIS